MSKIKKIILIIIVLLSCKFVFASEQEQYKIDKKDNSSSYLLFPINIVPNIVTNTTWYCFTGTRLLFTNIEEPAWGIIIILSTPFYGIYAGVNDTINGHPFWEIPTLRNKQHIPQDDNDN